MKSVRVVSYGIGVIGQKLATHLLEKEGVEIVGAVDINPKLIGKDLGEVLSAKKLGVKISSDVDAVLDDAKPDIVCHTTMSYLKQTFDQFDKVLGHGVPVVSTCEELSYPYATKEGAEYAVKLDKLAKKCKAAILGTGVNPGFLMDTLPLALTAICQRVDHIAVTRVVNASQRRGPFQAKIGSGMTVADFNAKMAAGRMGHVGLPESVGMVFHTLGKTLVRYESGVEPVVADRLVKTEYFTVQPGQVMGLKQVSRGYAAEAGTEQSRSGEFMALIFIAALDAGEDGDTIQIMGKPDLEVKLKGTNGDIATVAIAVNAVRRVKDAAPGLVTMRDLPIVTVW